MSLRALAFGDVVGREGLGDAVCYRWEVDAARQAVQAMNAAFTTSGSPSSWKLAVAAINAKWKAWEDRSWWEDFGPASYCNAKEVGKEAELVTAGIAADQGAAAPPRSPNLAPGPVDSLSRLVSAVTVVSVGLLLWKAFDTVRRVER